MITGVLEIATVLSLLIPQTPFPWWVSPIIQSHLNDLGLSLVDHLSLYLSACPIRHPLQRSVSCGNRDSTVQWSCPHKCGVSSFPLDIPEFLSFRTSWKATLTIQNLYLTMLQLVRGDIHPQTWTTTLSAKAPRPIV